MKRILIAEVARFERQRRMARQQEREARAALPVPGADSPYDAESRRALEISALSSLMLARVYRR